MYYLDNNNKKNYHCTAELYIIYITVYIILPIPMGARSKAWMCGHSLARIPGSNPARGHGYIACVL